MGSQNQLIRTDPLDAAATATRINELKDLLASDEAKLQLNQLRKDAVAHDVKVDTVTHDPDLYSLARTQALAQLAAHTIHATSSVRGHTYVQPKVGASGRTQLER